ncbi:MAG: YihY/virulence factor BrkB family protein [Acidobacteriota bacterium]|nr:YihY/virulence factor BrkB family protein [Acidobacteriota bacterium]
MAEVSNPGMETGATVTSAEARVTADANEAASEPMHAEGVVDVAELVAESKWFRWRHSGKALISYLLDSEVHTFAFSVAANAIISFIPFIILLYTLADSYFHSRAMVDVVGEMVHYFLPSNQDWVALNLQVAAARHGIQWFSLLMILVSCTGIFLPLEVALNQAWGVARSRNYLMNQLVAFGLAILMVGLAMGSIVLSTWQRQVLSFLFFGHTDNFFFNSISYLWLAISTGVACILFFFFIYWLLPNRRVPWRPVMRTAVVTGIIWLLAKNIFVSVLPHLDLKALYGPFYVSVGLLFWAYTSGLILFAGAQFSVARWGSGNHD